MSFLTCRDGEDEFPTLTSLGLYAMDTDGNGNCLFNALSDQLYGSQSKHAELRSSTINYMRDHGTYYKQFIVVHPGGGTRRNPKRKNAGGFSTRVSNRPATAEEIDRTFESHLGQMARGGTYGDNLEIAAFSSAFRVKVKIYRRDMAYLVTPKADAAVPAGSVVPVVHIAHHTWEHFSSVRNRAGPHTGLPHVKSMADNGAPEIRSPQITTVGGTNPPLDIDTVRKYLGHTRSVSDVIALRDQEKSTTPSTQGSSSAGLDLDSDDEEPVRGPNKRQNRRMSLASKLAKENEVRSQGLTYRPKTEYSATTEKPSTSAPSNRAITTVVIEDSEEEAWRRDGSRRSSESASFSTSSSEPSVAYNATSTAVRLKLSQPKKAGESVKKAANRGRERPVVGAKAKTSTYKGTARDPSPNYIAQRRLMQERKRHYRSAVVPEKKAINARPGTKPLMTTQGNERASMVETRIKVLCV